MSTAPGPAFPQEVLDLVERYSREQSALQSNRYGEADTRKEFIEPLFVALGWDVLNAAKHAEPYKDVVNEYNLKIGESHGAPDYAFRVGGARKFFVEAKRPALDISKDRTAAYQLRRYGWTAKLPLSVLTNFRHLAVYDCSQQPSASDQADAARILLVPWNELTERWTEIQQLVGKTAVYQGSLDRFAAGSSQRRGTLEVDDAFLIQMERWRLTLASNIAVRNPELTIEQLNESIQQTIDRLVFLRFAEDRGIEPYHRLRDQLKGGTGVYQRLLHIFRDADTRYNSGLFHFRTEKGVSGSPDLLTPGLVIDDDVLHEVITNMYYPASPYEFSVLSVDILGQVYEQFLGKVIHLGADRSVSIDDKPEIKRRTGGVYYTPTYIVDHIVELTLGPLLLGRTAAQVLNLRILDPACGSGSFLLRAFDRLLDWFQVQYNELPPKQRSRFMYDAGPLGWRLTLDVRKKILTSCIYGVDIDRQAVEVTKLSLMLKVLEGESGESINRQLELFHAERVLPDLDRNIRCGNSLVESDASDLIDLKPQEGDDLNAFDWEFEFDNIIRAGGFHVVIGNPPYDVLEKDRRGASWPHDKLRQYLPHKSAYAPALGHKLNLFRLFVVQSVHLTRSDGRFGMIVPLSLAADISTLSTRQFVCAELREVWFDCFPQKDSPARRVFKRAKLSTMIVAGVRRKRATESDDGINVRVFPGNNLTEAHLQNVVRPSDCRLIDPVVAPFPLTSAEDWAICKKLLSGGGIARLGSLNDSFEISRGEVNTSISRPALRSSAEDGEPLLKGAAVGPFELRSSMSQGEWEWLDLPTFRSMRRTLTYPPIRRIATQRVTGVDERRRVVAAIIDKSMWFADSTNSIASVPGASLPLEYLVALLNSDLMQWRFKLTSTNNNVGTNELEALPIRVLAQTDSELDKSAYARIIGSSNKISPLLRELRAASGFGADRIRRRVDAEWRALNSAVFDLYGVSEEGRTLITSRVNQRIEAER